MSRTEEKKSLEINAMLNIIKHCCAIIFPLITFPYVARKLGSEGYGAYNFSWSFVSYFIMIAALGIQTYSVREGARIRDNKCELEKFSTEIFTINCISSFVAIVLLFSITMISPKLNRYILFISIESFSMVLGLLGRDWLNTIHEDYLFITVRYVIIQILALIGMFVFIHNSEDVWIYCILVIFASYGGNIPNFFYTKRYAKLKMTRNIQSKKHIIPLLTLFANTVAMMVFVNSDVIMLGFFYDDTTVGVYSLASKVYSIIKQMLNAIVIVALPKVTSVIDRSKQEYNDLLKKVFNYLVMLMVPVSAGIFMLSDSVIILAGDREYLSGDSSMKVLAMSLFFAMTASFLMNCILIANRKDIRCFVSTLIAAVTNVVLNLILLRRIGIVGAAITTLIAELVNALIMLYYSKQIVHERIIDIRNLIESIFGSTGIVVCCYLSNIFVSNVILKSLIAISTSISFYSAFMLIVKNKYFRGLLKPILRRSETKKEGEKA